MSRIVKKAIDPNDSHRRKSCHGGACMLKRHFLLLTFFLILCYNVSLLGEELVETYFPSTLGSVWVYEDQDGNELIREAVEGKEIPEDSYHAFIYKPNIKDWTSYKHHFHPLRFQVRENSITFFARDGIEKMIKARLTKEIETIFRMEPPEDGEHRYDVKVDVQDQFLMLSLPVSLNEE